MLQPLFFIQVHGKAPHAGDRDCSLFAYIHEGAGRRSLFEGGHLIHALLHVFRNILLGIPNVRKTCSKLVEVLRHQAERLQYRGIPEVAHVGSPVRLKASAPTFSGLRDIASALSSAAP